MNKVYIYVVARDFGFAPNPFHGLCTLATCKPIIRNNASIGDWIFGIGGGRLDATGKCIYAMRVSKKLSYNEYWNNPIFHDKKPVRNGSKRMVVGDNIYYYDCNNSCWHQADSHHSNPDGSINESNLRTDTKSESVLISSEFYYFGRAAPTIPTLILSDLGYFNKVGHWSYSLDQCFNLIEWLKEKFGDWLNSVKSKPFDFDISHAKYSAGTNKLTH